MNTYLDRGKGELWKATSSVQFATSNWMHESMIGTTMTSTNVNNLSMVCFVCHQGCKHESQVWKFSLLPQRLFHQVANQNPDLNPWQRLKKLTFTRVTSNKAQENRTKEKVRMDNYKVSKQTCVFRAQSELYCVPLQIEWKHC